MMDGLVKRQAPLDNGDSNGNGNGNGNDSGYSGYDGYGGYNGGNESWWWSPPGMAVRYAIVAVLFALVLAFFVGGYYHAKSRLRKGLPLKPYHRWMVRSTTYYPQPRYGRQDPYGQSYGMDNYPPPPPAYNPAEAPPPQYQPPPGATKAAADQNFRETNRAGESSGSGMHQQ